VLELHFKKETTQQPTQNSLTAVSNYTELYVIGLWLKTFFTRDIDLPLILWFALC